MFIVEKRRIKRNYPYNKEIPYVWDRTFYVCKSERVDGKPKRITLGQFKNAESLLHAVELEKADLQKHMESLPFWKANGFGGRWLPVKEGIEQQIENLTAWSHLLPHWKAEETKPVPANHWPVRRKSSKPAKAKVTVKEVFDLYKQLDHAGAMEFFQLCKLHARGG